jgi:hypothetical protein
LEWQTLSDLARRHGPRPYDLDDPKDRRAFRGRLLSFLRPPGRDMMRELAALYHQRFGRPLPVTSLVRTAAYQRELGETNPNATRISVPPHTTGLAFDVYDHYMTAEEQDALMDEVAERERAGRVEALREQRDHIHIFAFADGRRPPETLIAQALGVVGPTRVAARTTGTTEERTVGAGGRSRAARALSSRRTATRKPAAVHRTAQHRRRR